MKKNELDQLLELAIEDLTQEYKSLIEKPSTKPAEPSIIMLPMLDGISLYTVCHMPDGSGPFPTIIMRCPYPFLEDLLRIHAQEFSKRGFAFVYQFCRGVGDSEGEWIPNVYERKDGYETLKWLSDQKWVENIGFWGSSYMALTGWIIGDLLPSKVKTMYLTHYGTDRFTSAYQNGLFRQDILTAWAMENAGFSIDADYFESLKYRPQILVDENLWGRKIDWYRDWITNTNRDDPYWKSGFWKLLKDIPSRIKIPIYIGEGWYDHHLGSALITYKDLSQESKIHSILRIGAWEHNFMPCLDGTECKNLQNKDSHSAFMWFDMILRKDDLPQGEVQYYQIGTDRWLKKSTYPFESKSKVLYLTGDRSEYCAHTITSDKLKNETKISYIFNPDLPVMSHGAESLLRTNTEIGSLLQPECEWREDVVSFISEPMDDKLDILGKIKIQLYVSSTAEDTAFTAKVMEVFPSGKAYNIRSGITTLGYRKSSDLQRMGYTPNRVVEAVIDFWDIAWRIQKNSRLRIDISSSDFPQYSVHTNYPGIWALQEKAQPAKQTLYFGPKHPTCVIIPST